MAKPFPLRVEVEQDEVGRIMIALTNMRGVLTVMPLIGENKPRRATNGSAGNASKRFGINAQTFVLQLLAKSPMTTRDIYPIFGSQGRKPSSSQSALNLAKKAGHARKRADGMTWEITSKGKAHLGKAMEAAKASDAGQ